MRAVTPLTLDVTGRSGRYAARSSASMRSTSSSTTPASRSTTTERRAAIERHLAVNLFGPYEMTQASCRS